MIESVGEELKKGEECASDFMTALVPGTGSVDEGMAFVELSGWITINGVGGSTELGRHFQLWLSPAPEGKPTAWVVEGVDKSEALEN